MVRGRYHGQLDRINEGVATVPGSRLFWVVVDSDGGGMRMMRPRWMTGTNFFCSSEKCLDTPICDMKWTISSKHYGIFSFGGNFRSKVGASVSP